MKIDKVRSEVIHRIQQSNNVINHASHNAVITSPGKSSELVQCAMLKACDACADIDQL